MWGIQLHSFRVEIVHPQTLRLSLDVGQFGVILSLSETRTDLGWLDPTSARALSCRWQTDEDDIYLHLFLSLKKVSWRRETRRCSPRITCSDAPGSRPLPRPPPPSPCSPSSTSSSCSGTRSWSASPSGRGRERSLSSSSWWGIGWSGTPSPAPGSGSECMSACPSSSLKLVEYCNVKLVPAWGLYLYHDSLSLS